MPVSGGEPDGGGRAGGVAGHSASAVFDGDAAEDGASWTAAWAVPDDDAPVGERSTPAASAVLEVGASTGDDAPVGKGYDAAASAVLDVGASAGDATVGEGSNVVSASERNCTALRPQRMADWLPRCPSSQGASPPWQAGQSDAARIASVPTWRMRLSQRSMTSRPGCIASG